MNCSFMLFFFCFFGGLTQSNSFLSPVCFELSVKDLDNEVSEEEEEEEEEEGHRNVSKSRKKLAREHKDQLQKLKEKVAFAF